MDYTNTLTEFMRAVTEAAKISKLIGDRSLAVNRAMEQITGAMRVRDVAFAGLAGLAQSATAAGIVGAIFPDSIATQQAQQAQAMEQITKEARASVEAFAGAMRKAVTVGSVFNASPMDPVMKQFTFQPHLMELSKAIQVPHAALALITSIFEHGMSLPHVMKDLPPWPSILDEGNAGLPAGLMTAFDAPGPFGAFVWSPSADDTDCAANIALWHQPENIDLFAMRAPTTIAIDCFVECMICGDQMLARTDAILVEGRVRLGISVFPLCAACTRRADGSPGYWDEWLHQRSRPRLTVIGGGGLGDGKPAAVLHLVRSTGQSGENGGGQTP